jgi:aspartate/methionine/tyrosine aminotransferase
MRIPTFALERHFAKHEFSARYLLSCSDCEALSLAELLAMADAESVKMWEGLRLGYTESQGHPSLRAAIAELYEGIEADDVLVMVPEEGIFLLMNALLEPGDHVVCTFPGYQSLYEVARAIGCELSMWEPDETRGWHFDLARFEEMLRPDTKLVVVNTPHNPTGAVMTGEDFESVVTLVRGRGAHLLSDEMYRFLEIEPASTLPSACELYEHACSLFGLSKTFGLPGLRVGWIVSKDHAVLGQMAALKDYTTICGSAPSEILAIIALRSRTAIIEAQLRRLRSNLAVLDEFFDEFQDCLDWVRPVGGSVCFPRLLVDRDASVFCDELIEQTGIMLVPSTVFGFGERHVRIGFGRNDLPEVIECFADYLADRFRSAGHSPKDGES